MTVVQLFDTAKGLAPVTNLFAAGDPDVHKFGDRWWMFFGSMHTERKVNLFSASLPPGAPLSSTKWSVTGSQSDPQMAASLVQHPEEGAWDEWLHTPCYVRGSVPTAEGERAYRERIYYTGSRGASPDDRHYSIGVLEKTDTGWVRHTEPVLAGATENASVLEPKVGYYDGKWRIWYLSLPHGTGQEDLKHSCQVAYVESEDGLRGWSTPRVLFPEADNYYDAVVAETARGYEMIVARPPNLLGASGFPPQGLWWLASRLPSGDRSDWTDKPVSLLDTNHAEPWYASGVWGPSLRYGDTALDNDTLYVFFTGAARPDPHPFMLSIGRIAIPSESLRTRM